MAHAGAVATPAGASAIALVLPRGLEALPALLAALALVQGGARAPGRAALRLVTYDTRAAAGGDLVRPAHAAAWGLARSARAEAPLLSLRCADVAGDGATSAAGGGAARALAALAQVAATEAEVAVRRGAPQSPRLAMARSAALEAPPSAAAPSVRSAELVTGGTGGLGTATAEWRAEASRGAHLVLVSRGAAVWAGAAERLRACGASGVTVRRCDASERTACLELAASMARALPPLRAVWHTAGVLADALVGNQGASTVRVPSCPRPAARRTCSARTRRRR